MSGVVMFSPTENELVYTFHASNPAPVYICCEAFEIPGDIDNDHKVDFVDFALLTAYWLETNCGIYGSTDLPNDGNVDFNDLKQLAENWLAGVE